MLLQIEFLDFLFGESLDDANEASYSVLSQKYISKCALADLFDYLEVFNTHFSLRDLLLLRNPINDCCHVIDNLRLPLELASACR